MAMHRSQRGKIRSTSQMLNEEASKLEAQGRRIIRMHIGAPATSAPAEVIQAAVQSEKNMPGYTSALGIMPLRERIAHHYQEEYGVTVNPHRVVVTIGASLGLIAGTIACLDQGGKFALPYPVYAAYEHTLEMLGINIVPIETHAKHGFQATAEDLKKCRQTFEAFIIASPSNPVGTMLSDPLLKELVEYCDEKKIQLFSDEIYHGVVFNDEKPQTALKYSDNVIILNSFSKYYSMPGWRIGWMVVPEDLVQACGSIIRNLYLSPPTISQFVALHMMDHREELNQHVKRYRHNRDILVKGLHEAGFNDFIIPDGAFYLYVNTQHLHDDSTQLCHKMLNEIGIAAMPGTDFDPHRGHHYIRLAFAGTTADIEEAVRRLKEWSILKKI